MPVIPQNYQGLGELIRTTRKSLGATQKYIGRRAGRVTASYICQIEKAKAKPSDAFLQNLERALELRAGTLFVRIGKPPFDLIKTLLEPKPAEGDPLADMKPHEREELIKYLNFLRVQAQIRRLLTEQPPTQGGHGMEHSLDS